MLSWAYEPRNMQLLASGKTLGIPLAAKHRRMRRMCNEKTACSQKCHIDCTRMLH